MRENIENRIQIILDSVFPLGSPKRLMRKSEKSTYIACPYCGDSEKDMSKKRFTIYWEYGTCYCYNCQKFKKLNFFLDEYHVTLDNSNYKWISSQQFKYYEKKLNKSKNNFFYDLDSYNKLYELAVDIKDICKILRASYPGKEHDYLRSRNLLRKSTKYNFLVYNTTNENYKDNIVIMNKITKDKLIGLTFRDNRKNAKNKYFVLTLKKIYEKYFPKKYEKLLEEGADLNIYNTISYYYGFFELDFDKPVTVFEGPIDRLFFPNSVAISSLWRDYSFFKELGNDRYFFDDDVDGKKHSLNLLKNKKNVFMWNKFKKDFKLNHKNIKDFNDLINFSIKEKKSYFLETPNYFTNDKLNIMMI